MKPITKIKLRASAKRGAKFLDKRYPNWYQEIKLSKLKLSDCQVCVIGQLAPKATFLEAIGWTPAPWRGQDYSPATDAYFGYFDVIETVIDGDFAFNDAEARRLGFMYSPERGDVGWGILTEAWKNEIRARRAKALVSA